MRQTTAEVRLDTVRAERFSASTQSTDGFDRLLARDARFIVAQDARGSNPGPKISGIRGISV